MSTGPSKTQALNQVPVEELHGVGPKVAEQLARIGITSVRDLLFHLPLRYQDRSRVVPIADLEPGTEVLVEGEIRDVGIGYGRRRSLKVWLADASEQGGILLRFFHFSGKQAAALKPGTKLRCFGEVRRGPQSLEMVHPEYRHYGRAEPPPLEDSLTPIYPTTEGLQQSSWRLLTDQALALLEQDDAMLEEWLPREVLERFRFPTLAAALRLLHRPPAATSAAALRDRRHPALRRLVFDELVAHQLGLRRLRYRQQRIRAPVLSGDRRLRAKLLAGLPFELTAAQHRVTEEIARDLQRPHPMLRLLQGDVGSGKTVVAALASLQAVESGRQVALMAPTELLSEQHLRNLRGWLEPLGLDPLWLTGRHKGRERAELVARIAGEGAPVMVGTHALFQDDVRFRDLGLVIVDEQHRFGVHQRMKLKEKGARAAQAPHQLIMTATPIPRSLAMTLYADLDLSVIDELPPDRTPVTTVAVSDGRRQEVIERVRDACIQGRQAYWVCTLIDESEALQCRAAEDTAEALAASLPELRVGLVHGRLKATEREPVMAGFAAGELDLLVATTLIEVGVDVPNASLMIIENPERLGLAQLHQLRGRVGRGSVRSHCVLLYHAPLSPQARARLAILRESSDGFEIARKDLKLRGPGEVLGTRQTGGVQFRIADPAGDEHLLPAARQTADLILDRYPGHVRPLIERWLGERVEYGRV
ncbi:ATP-dependent DNA helicase RecG [Candidatus Thiosymbion oneisti]|uniref:ATP-dependent DNA helicase RecG n=1 Tax=Candidatus Thiosymbion oneisti TaxID=589554 RepID=UPI000A9167AF|nr:ATP-dependent DNA helicase RecG [Candidatus Thiosymbion oneisti]